MTTARQGSGSGAAFRDGPFRVEPFTAACRSVWEQRQHIVVGVSPGNSYFRVPRLVELLGWLRGEFARVDVVIPDSALRHTYLALGHDADQAAKKTRGEINVLHNRVVRAWAGCGGQRRTDGLHRMSDLESGTVYREKLAECERALATDRALRRTCEQMSREVLAGKGHRGPLTADRLDRAMRYLVAELPFFLASADIFRVPSSLNFYHQRLPLAELLFAGRSVLRPSPRQGYAIIRPPD